jgi:hypothetical protein
MPDEANEKYCEREQHWNLLNKSTIRQSFNISCVLASMTTKKYLVIFWPGNANNCHAFGLKAIINKSGV